MRPLAGVPFVLLIVPALVASELNDGIRAFQAETAGYSNQLYQLQQQIEREQVEWSREMAQLERDIQVEQERLESLRTEHAALQKNLAEAKLTNWDLNSDSDFVRSSLHGFRSFFESSTHVLEIPQFSNLCSQARSTYSQPGLTEDFQTRHLAVLEAAVKRSALFGRPRRFAGSAIRATARR